MPCSKHSMFLTTCFPPREPQNVRVYVIVNSLPRIYGRTQKPAEQKAAESEPQKRAESFPKYAETNAERRAENAAEDRRKPLPGWLDYPVTDAGSADLPFPGLVAFVSLVDRSKDASGIFPGSRLFPCQSVFVLIENTIQAEKLSFSACVLLSINHQLKIRFFLPCSRPLSKVR